MWYPFNIRQVLKIVGCLMAFLLINTQGFCRGRLLFEEAQKQCAQDNRFITPSQMFATEQNCVANKFGELLAREQIRLIEDGSLKGQILSCKKDATLKDLDSCFSEYNYSESCRDIKQCIFKTLAEDMHKAENECAANFSDKDGSYLYLFSDCQRGVDNIFNANLGGLARSQFLKYSDSQEKESRSIFNFFNKRWLCGTFYSCRSPVSINDILKDGLFFVVIFIIAIVVILYQILMKRS